MFIYKKNHRFRKTLKQLMKIPRINMAKAIELINLIVFYFEATRQLGEVNFSYPQ